MLVLLARVVIGVVATNIFGGVAYVAYKHITKDAAKSEINKKIENNEIFKTAFKAKVNSKTESISIDDLDEWDEPLEKVESKKSELITVTVMDEWDELLEKVESKKSELITVTVMDEWDEHLGYLVLCGDEIDNEVGEVILL